MPYLQETPLNRAIVAPSIYGDFPNHVTDLALVIETYIKSELERFIREYAAFLDAQEKYFRVDLYFDDECVYVIEVNVEVADGWGVALNLLRAADHQLTNDYEFPSTFPTFDDDPRQTEFALAISELARLGYSANMRQGSPGRNNPLDDKRKLARFAESWQSTRVHIPQFFCRQSCPWGTLPKAVFLKRVDDIGAKRQQVTDRRICRFQNDFKQQYRKGRVIAQAAVEPYQTEQGEPVQAIVMCAGAQVVTGYIQVAPAGRNVINDKGTKKGALIFL